jgi:hypothetical protein
LGSPDLNIGAHAPQQAFWLLVEFDSYLEHHVAAQRGCTACNLCYFAGKFFA